MDPAPSPSVAPATGIRLGVVGMPTSINPLTARTQADRDLVALVFSGLVKLGPKDVILPDLADRWTTDKTGRHWTFHLRDSSATWHDGEPVTADDVVFTLRLLRDPKYRGPFVGSWNEITVKKVNAHDRPLRPEDAARRLPSAGSAAAPAGASPEIDPCAGARRILRSARHPSARGRTACSNGTRRSPCSSGERLRGRTATAVRRAPAACRRDPPDLEFRFFPSAAALASAYRRGEVDVQTACRRPLARSLDALPADRVVRYPRATLDAVLLNLRTNHPTIRDDTVRTGAAHGRRPARLVTDVMGGLGDRADSLSRRRHGRT